MDKLNYKSTFHFRQDTCVVYISWSFRKLYMFDIHQHECSSKWRTVPLEDCPGRVVLLENCPWNVVQVEERLPGELSPGGPGGLSWWRTVLVEDCPGRGLSWWRTVLVEDCPGGGLSWWRNVLVEDWLVGGLPAGAPPANL